MSDGSGGSGGAISGRQYVILKRYVGRSRCSKPGRDVLDLVEMYGVQVGG